MAGQRNLQHEGPARRVQHRICLSLPEAYKPPSKREAAPMFLSAVEGSAGAALLLSGASTIEYSLPIVSLEAQLFSTMKTQNKGSFYCHLESSYT